MESVAFNLNGIVIIVGNYGSGKTEVAINLAAVRSQAGDTVHIADLDLVNPYFRTREATGILTNLGVDVVLPPQEYLHADLPILSPIVAGLIKRPGQLTLLDVGGNGVGARVLAALADALAHQDINMLQVINPYRPFTDSFEGCDLIRNEIQEASQLRVTGIIGNPNLIELTTPKDVYNGYAFVSEYAEKSGLPLVMTTVPSFLADRLDINKLDGPLLKIQRQLVPPWRKAEALQGNLHGEP
jgi:hypothetical protein